MRGALDIQNALGIFSRKRSFTARRSACRGLPCRIHPGIGKFSLAVPRAVVNRGASIPQTYGYGDDSAGRPADSSSVGLSLSVAIGDMSFRSYAYVIVRFDERAHARSSVTLSVKTTLGNRPALDASSGMPHADVVFRHVGVRRTGRRLTLIGDGMRACRCGEGVCLSGRRSMVWYSCRRSRRFDRVCSLVPSSCSYSQTSNDSA